jgi:hypothetical protein
MKMKKMKFIGLLFALTCFSYGERCSGIITSISERGSDVLVYFSPNDFTQIIGTIDDSEAINGIRMKYVRLSKNNPELYKSQLSIILTAFTTGKKIYVDYNSSGWIAEKILLQN